MKYFVARDKFGADKNGLMPLYMYNSIPDRGDDVWIPIDVEALCIEIAPTLFPELKWEDEPIEVELTIKKASTKAVPEEETGLSFSYDETTMTASVNALENEKVDSVTIPSKVLYNGNVYDVTKIGKYAFYNCTSLTSIEIPNSITEIGYEAFEDCSKLISIEIPESVTTIGDEAFEGCKSLTSIEIPNSVTTIGENAFYACTGLESIVIPNSVTEIGYGAFSGCTSLTSIVVDKDNKVYDSRDNCNAIIETAYNALILGCPNTAIPESVTTIGNYAFEGCNRLTSIEIPNSVTYIGNDAFYSCTNLTSVVIPNSVTKIGYGAFSGCTNLKTVCVPVSLKGKVDYVFPETCKIEWY